MTDIDSAIARALDGGEPQVIVSYRGVTILPDPDPNVAYYDNISPRGGGYEVVSVKRNRPGYDPVLCFQKMHEPDAKKLADALNRAKGMTKRRANAIILSSMNAPDPRDEEES